MRDYEAMYILRPEMAEEEYAAAVEKFNALIQANGGEVVKTDIWGKRRLAYEIEKLREGYYVLVTFKAEPELPQELERNFRIADSVLRYLVTRLPE
ncbi:MAG TPA: 30S ribosomal protein S6 [Candidatus Avidehalobacter gallistercoris]|uniref:Small ribosomal subunit protein bS6 n=1 Tax=Candidatus Avidehalobacter gallistercoris TaxID=2840694 RepID=A0A9D1HMQ7_9FIRM|nr:30S ribosomal protein S6 [Candidatus Avidehalobacter gallistercoris]